MNPRAAVVAEALSWLGTPYHHHARIKGAGVDCAQILLAIYADALGLAPPLDVGQYSTQWHLHRGEEVYLDWLDQAGATRLQTPAQPGDIAMYRFGRTFSHSGIVVEAGADPLLVHALVNVGVLATRASEAPLCDRPARYFTLPGLAP